MGFGLGETITAITKINRSLLSGNNAYSMSELGSPKYNVSDLVNQLGIGDRIERGLANTRSEVLPRWLSTPVPTSNNKRPLGIAIHNDTHSPDKPQQYSSLGEAGNASAIRGGTWSGLNGEGSIKSLAKGFVRPTKYKVLLGVPTAISAHSNEKECSFSCSAAVLPGKALSTFDDRQGSPNIMKKPYDVIYEDVKLTFQVTENMKERELFENWIAYIYDDGYNVFAYPENYYAAINIIQLDNELNEAWRISLIKAYPTSMSEIALSYDAHDAIETFDVNFSYERWV